MLYIKFTKDYLEYFEEDCKYPDFLKKLIFMFRKFFGKITKIKNDNGEVVLIPEKSNKFKKSLMKFLKIYYVKTVVLANDLQEFREDIENQKIKILDGKWLYKYLLSDVVDFVVKNKGVALNEQTISFAVNSPDDIDLENLKNLARNCRSLNLITKDEYRFKKLEETMYKEDGVALNIAYNYKKSLLKSDIVINVDLNEKEFNKFAFPRKAVIINLKNVKIHSKGFNGINILKYEIDFPKQYENEILNLDSFNKEILYESYIYKRTAPKNILTRIKRDGLQVARLLGKNGYIDQKEYERV